MKTNKMRFLALLLSVLLMLTSHSVSAQGVTPTDEYGFMATNEPAMPTALSAVGGAQTQNVGNSLAAQREIWLDQIVEYNENHYDQAVSTIVEDNEKYTLFFEPKQIDDNQFTTYDYALTGIEEIDASKWGVSRIEYLKPEAISLSMGSTNIRPNSTIVVNGTTYDYKFTYYYAWSNGYYKIQSKNIASYLAAAAANLTLSYTPDGLSKLATWIIGQAVGDMFSAFDQSLPVTAETHCKYYYENKVCSVKPTGTSYWYPTCQIGRRLSFGWSWSTVRLKATGEPTLYIEQNPKDGNGTPPTNYDSQAKKSNFDNNTWMINKAIETMTTGGYANVFAICTNLI